MLKVATLINFEDTRLLPCD